MRAEPAAPTMCDHALAYVRRGWRVFPCRDKQPLIPGGFHNASSDPEQVRAWWTEHADAQIGWALPDGWFAVDIDSTKGGEASFEELERLVGELPETLAQITGSDGWHLIYRVPDGATVKQRVKRLPGLDTRVGGKGYLIVAPSLNPGTGKTYRWADEREPVEAPPALVSFFAQAKKEKEPSPRKSDDPVALISFEVKVSAAAPDGPHGAYARAALRDELATLRKAEEGERNDQLNRGAFSLGQLVGAGVLYQEKVEALLASAATDIGLDADEVAATLASGLAAGMATPRELTSALPVTTILVRPQLAEMVDESEVALDGSGVYARHGVLSRVVRDGARKIAGLSRAPGAPVIAPAKPTHVRELLSRHARFVHRSKKKSGEVVDKVVMPPPAVAEALVERGEWALPSLEGITETPFLRPDGTVCALAGYDAQTGLLLELGDVLYDDIPDSPTVDDARRACDILCGPLRDFPFVSPSDRAATIAAVLSIIARPAIAGPVPLFAFRAPVPGAGKGLLADYVTILSTGRSAAICTPDRDDTEMKKHLLAIGFEAQPVVLLDNVNGAFGSNTMAAALTAETYRGRLLGFSKEVTVPMRSVWLLTGNGVTFKGDLGRRVVPINLDPRCEHPEDRTGFEHADLRAHVRARRPRLVTAALTILRAHTVAGRPGHGQPRKGSFESWDDVVRAALIFAGAPDPLGGVAQLRQESDSDLEALRVALSAWSVAYPDRAVTAAQAVRDSAQKPDLHVALQGLVGLRGRAQLSPADVGYALRRLRGRIADGQCFEQGGQVHKVVAWRVVTAT